MKTILLLLSLIIISCSVEYATTSREHNNVSESNYPESPDTTLYVDNDFSLYLNSGYYPFIYNPYIDPFLWEFSGYYGGIYYPYFNYGIYKSYRNFGGGRINRFYYTGRQNYVRSGHRPSFIPKNRYIPTYYRPRYNTHQIYNNHPIRSVTKYIPSRIVTPYRYNYSPSRMIRSYSGGRRK